MKIGYKLRVVGKLKKVIYPDDFFERDDAIEDSNGALLCPICRCCALKEVDSGWICLGGCSASTRHAA